MNAGLVVPCSGLAVPCSLFPDPWVVLLRLFVVRVLAAGIAELRELKPARGRLLVLRRRVVPVLAIRTLQGDDLAHWVLLELLTWPATSTGKQLGRIAATSEASLPLRTPARLTRRNAGL